METRTRKTPGNLLEFQSLFRVKQQNVKRWLGSRSGFIAATRAFRGKRKYYPKYSGDGRRPLWQYVFSLGKYFIGRESSRSCDPGSRASQKSGKLLNLVSLLSASIVLSPVFQQRHKTHYLRVNLTWISLQTKGKLRGRSPKNLFPSRCSIGTMRCNYSPYGLFRLETEAEIPPCLSSKRRQLDARSAFRRGDPFRLSLAIPSQKSGGSWRNSAKLAAPATRVYTTFHGKT